MLGAGGDASNGVENGNSSAPCAYDFPIAGTRFPDAAALRVYALGRMHTLNWSMPLLSSA